jgi:hypothetical protein
MENDEKENTDQRYSKSLSLIPSPLLGEGV